MKAGLLLILAACGGSGVQVSPCGLSLFGSDPTFDVAACDAVRFVSDVYGLSRVSHAAESFTVVVVPHGSLPNEDAGLTYCESGRIVIDSDDWYPSALAHELVHATECAETDNDHVTWGDKNDPASTWAAVERFHAEAQR